MDAVNEYKKLLSGKIEKMPRGIWSNPENPRKVVRYLLEEKLGWSKEDIQKKFSGRVLKENKLRGLLKVVYDFRVYNVLQDVYPCEFLPWEIKEVPRGYWDDIDNCRRATEWLLEDQLEWSKEDIKQKYSSSVFHQHGLPHLYRAGWRGDAWRAIEETYPGEFKREEMKNL
jgi:hypothetical protein